MAKAQSDTPEDSELSKQLDHCASTAEKPDAESARAAYEATSGNSILRQHPQPRSNVAGLPQDRRTRPSLDAIG